MPDTATHYYFGQQVFKQLPINIQSIIARNKSAYNLGLQGPDLLFYYKPLHTKKIMNLGISIHYRPAKYSIGNAIRSLHKSYNETTFSYLLGYVCHFILDSSFHGEITRIAPSTKEHFQLESELERLVILNHYLDKPVNFKRYKLLKTDYETYDWLRPVYPQLNKTQLKDCAKSIVFYMWILNSKKGWRKWLVFLIEKIQHKHDFLSSMMVSQTKDPRFHKDAMRLYGRMDAITTSGVKALENVFACLHKKEKLSDLFEKNFE